MVSHPDVCYFPAPPFKVVLALLISRQILVDLVASLLTTLISYLLQGLAENCGSKTPFLVAQKVPY
jgi:hypothetical protein